ncbi:uncharacterized protein [Taeniopygia guttata]|uniref:uncharacterized protein isoform X3 n=1 Tax=Taeniopygia guttata TaxID=59729 RepID=UPI003BB99982
MANLQQLWNRPETELGPAQLPLGIPDPPARTAPSSSRKFQKKFPGNRGESGAGPEAADPRRKSGNSEGKFRNSEIPGKIPENPGKRPRESQEPARKTGKGKFPGKQNRKEPRTQDSPGAVADAQNSWNSWIFTVHAEITCWILVTELLPSGVHRVTPHNC